METQLEPQIFDHNAELFEALQAEFQTLPRDAGPQLICLATGSTFADFYGTLSVDSELMAAPLACTHLDEYAGFASERQGGMAWELSQTLPALAQLRAEGRFLPFPHHVDQLTAHAEQVASLGGVALQLLGIGRNGHLAFNEPGAQRDAHFKAVELHPWTIADMGQRFAPEAAPTQALTSGLADILAARRIVFVARGAKKAEAVRRMLREPVSDDCPASHLCSHPNLRILLDREAAALL